ncbi:hypothetical protein BGZ93_004971 [Podila epicladia]|nr:hypothetical protein BGZ92_004560 [Podila epicladia]KAG0096139.1 hypothetical protein BGZ93_004971 [Podila epicladia]
MPTQATAATAPSASIDMSDSTQICPPDTPTTGQRSTDAVQMKTFSYTNGTTINGPTVNDTTITATNGTTTNGTINGATTSRASNSVAHFQQPRPSYPKRFVQPVQPLVIPTTSDSQAEEAIRTHAYWSGFYKKTIKERRTQLGLAFPYLTKPSSLDNFASAQTSAKTSGQSTPNLGPSSMHRSLTMTAITLPTVSSPLSAATLTTNTTTTTKKLIEVLSSSEPSVGFINRPNVPATVNGTDTDTDSNSDSGEKTLFDFTDDDKEAQTTRSTPKHDEPKDPLFDQEDEAMTEEERRDQLERERKATVISDLTEQRRMIGSPNGSLLEGDLSLDARLDAIIATEQEGTPFPVNGLDEQIANNMIENCIGTLGLPMGLAFNFTINGSPLVVPMAIEEPSVIAAVSSAAKTISSYHGFQAWAPERNMIVAQVQLLDIADSSMDRVVQQMQDQEASIRDEANEYCTNMVLRGGGVQRVTLHRIRRRADREGFRGQDLLVKHGVISALKVPKREDGTRESSGQYSEWLVVHLHIDVGDAMGANCANTVAEGIAPYLAKLSGGRVGVRILSNLNVDRIAKSTFRLPFSHMAYKSLSGKDVAVRILEAYEWADLDPYRAATHNKGIMNGIDAVALATGQDWRAIEAGAHAWASGAGSVSERSVSSSGLPTTISSLLDSGSNKRKFEGEEEETRIYRGDAYRPLTRYWIEEDKERMRQGHTGQDALVFCGELEMPIMVGTKGGVLSTNPVHAFTLGVMKYPDSKQLAMAMVTTGLAQNFAALRALVTEGIQRGHMALHARNIAISAGTPPVSVDEVTAYMIGTGKIRLGAARSYIAARGLGIYNQPSSSLSSLSSLATTSPGASDDQPSV